MFPISIFVLITLGKNRLCVCFWSLHEQNHSSIRKFSVLIPYREMEPFVNIAFSARQHAEN